MPIFEYKCESCGINWEDIGVKKNSIECPRCKTECKRVPSSSNFHLHGGGVYNPINPKACRGKG